MATLYVENVPDELYEALRTRARARRRSIAAEVLTLLEESVPTEKELRVRRNFLRKLEPLLARGKSTKRFPSTEKMLREDRGR
jgi:plasmid stability protein